MFRNVLPVTSYIAMTSQWHPTFAMTSQWHPAFAMTSQWPPTFGNDLPVMSCILLTPNDILLCVMTSQWHLVFCNDLPVISCILWCPLNDIPHVVMTSQLLLFILLWPVSDILNFVMTFELVLEYCNLSITCRVLQCLLNDIAYCNNLQNDILNIVMAS